MVILCDTREKPKAIQLILKEFEKQHVTVIRNKLWVADYQRLDNPMLVVDRKQNLNELCNNVVHEHKRFTSELQRANDVGIHVVVLVEHSPQIKTLEDVRKWVNPRLRESPMAVSGERLFKILYAIQNHYGCEFQFCSKSETGKRIIQILGGTDATSI